MLVAEPLFAYRVAADCRDPIGLSSASTLSPKFSILRALAGGLIAVVLEANLALLHLDFLPLVEVHVSAGSVESRSVPRGSGVDGVVHHRRWGLSDSGFT